MYEHIGNDDRLMRRVVLAVQKAIVHSFSATNWHELGYKTGFEEYIQRHDRLLRSMRFGDDDYGACVFDTVKKILDAHIENLEFILEVNGVREWLLTNDPAICAEIGLSSDGLAPNIVTPLTRPSEVVERALRDADALIATNGAVSAIDRIHTALHGYLTEQCERAFITVGAGATITELYKALRQQHPALAQLGSWEQDMDRVLKSFASVIDALNHLRNQASVAHPNKNLLSEAEAELVVNATRTILHYINTKIG